MELKYRVWCEYEFDGKIEKTMESLASWFLLTQTGKLLSYGPGEPLQPLDKKYIKAIPLFYTGLKDKNGKEIYEGDVVRCPDYGVHVCEWDDEFAGFEFSDKDEHMEAFLGGAQYKNIEIIGNVYENPELLKRKRR